MNEANEVANDLNKLDHLRKLSEAQDMMIRDMALVEMNGDSLVTVLKTQVSTLKQARLHYKKLFVKTERSRREFRDLLIGGLAGVGIGVILKDEKMGLVAGISTYGLIKFKVLEISL